MSKEKTQRKKINCLNLPLKVIIHYKGFFILHGLLVFVSCFFLLLFFKKIDHCATVATHCFENDKGCFFLDSVFRKGGRGGGGQRGTVCERCAL